MKEALGATALVCHWLVRDRDRKLAALNAARKELDEVHEELDEAHEQREAAIVRRDAILAERAALDGELMRLAHTCDRLAEEQERGSAAGDTTTPDHKPTAADLQSALPAPPARPGGSSRVSSSAWSLPAGRAPELVRSFVRSPLGARTVAISAIAAVSVVLLLLLSGR